MRSAQGEAWRSLSTAAQASPQVEQARARIRGDSCAGVVRQSIEALQFGVVPENGGDLDCSAKKIRALGGQRRVSDRKGSDDKAGIGLVPFVDVPLEMLVPRSPPGSYGSDPN